MKKKKRAVLISITVIFAVLWITDIFFGSGFNVIVKEALIIIQGIVFFALLVYSLSQKEKTNKENEEMSLKLSDLIDVSNRLNQSFFDFYDRLINVIYTALNDYEYDKNRIEELIKDNAEGSPGNEEKNILEIAGKVISRFGKI